MRDRAGRAAAPAARCKNRRRGNFMAVPLRMLVTRLTIDAQSGGLMPPAGHIKICLQGTCFQGYLPADGTNAAVHWPDYGRSRWQLLDKIKKISGFPVRGRFFFFS